MTDNSVSKTANDRSKFVWQHVMHRQPFWQLESEFTLSQFSSFPNAAQLNHLKQQHAGHLSKQFIDQSELDPGDEYYETIIATRGVIPTRENSWHDLFNALVWLQFPATKSLLNQWHLQDIETYGISPRTLKRNNITLFDECGVVLAVADDEISNSLMQHQWSQAFFARRQCWGSNIKPFVFGHANLEMLLSPFIGLTGKWLSVIVPSVFFGWSYGKQLAHLDQQLASRLQSSALLELRNVLRPLPLLGIPGWCENNATPEFYANTDYFRPLPEGTKRAETAPML